MSEAKRELLKISIREFPESPGVYLMKNSNDKVIYVGKAKSLRARVRSYFNQSTDQSPKTVYLVNQIDSINYLITHTEVEAFLLEASLIKKFRPRYNIRLKDDKSYPYIRVSMTDDFPRFYLHRRVISDGSLYFGPYTNGGAVRDMIRFLNRSFKIRDCSDSFFAARKRPCMIYQIGRCSAPCTNLITKAQYLHEIKEALKFLRGGNKKLVRDLTQRMQLASREEKYESAARLRDSLRAISSVWERQSVVSINEEDIDVVAYHSDLGSTLIETLHIRSGRVIGNRSHFFPKLDVKKIGEDPREWMTSFLNQYYLDNVIPNEILLPVDLGGDIVKLLGDVFWERGKKRPRLIHALDEEGRRLMSMAESNAISHFKDQVKKREDHLAGLEEIKRKLLLPEFPRRIECFDISNFQGSQTVASQVVFEEGQPRPEEYRKYRINTVIGPNDFASMKEVLSRRLSHAEWEDPQLIVVDGGKGQLKIATEVLQELGRPEIPVVGLAKARTEGKFTDQEVHESQERFFLPGRQNPVTFRRGSSGLNILVQLRDEAHRVAITFHRGLRGKELLSSSLDKVRGLGEKKKKFLLTQFSSLEEIRRADVEELAALKGFNRAIAEGIVAALNESDPANEREKIEDV
ncbi:MAG: excinuclease ABC subunit UvrC [Bdellovibrionales bacterium]|nr:excinuclease ABC subunit UvrC [Bdellovibrionales bacterium]